MFKLTCNVCDYEKSLETTEELIDSVAESGGVLELDSDNTIAECECPDCYSDDMSLEEEED